MSMSLYRYSLIALLALVFGCRENQPQYNLIGPVDAQRTVLVEEFSGARCPNCPQGTAELDNLKTIYGDNLIIVTIHAGDFAFQYDDSKYDFTTSAGDQILDLLGNPIGYPSAVVNRFRPDNQTGYQTFLSRWGSLISAELEKPQVATLQISTDFNEANRQLLVEVVVSALETIQNNTRITVLLKEDNIVDPQADRAVQTGVVTDYVHKNVLRAFLTEFGGDPLADQLAAFEGITRSFTFTLPTENGWWNATEITAVAFISADEPDNIAILEATQQRIIPN